MNIWLLILLGWLVMAMVMAGLWLVQTRRHNAGVVDVAWSFGTGAMGVWFAWGADGDPARRWLIAILAGVWGARLGAHVAKRVFNETEDGRYKKLRQQWGERTQPYLFLFFQIQALWAVMFALPMLVAASNDTPGLRWFDYAGVAVWLISIGGETLADRQLARFRANPDNAGKVCRDGLWRYSRHPNYFFEWLHWWSYVLIGVGAAWWPATLAGPAVMLLFLFKVTGIPPTEARALESRGDAYREYQRTTSVFFPWPPKTNGATS